MWLLNRETYTLEEYDEWSAPRYLILSHTWAEEEVTFQDIQDLDKAKRMKGFVKISGICNTDLYPWIKHVWIDTCCIDKRNSTELSESLNSMFRWYQQAECCVVYLADLCADESGLGRTPTLAELQPCRWFTRCWTLQELIAPKFVYFFDQTWDIRGTKDELVNVLRQITSIDPATLMDAGNLKNILVARRISWAARRITTRIEDRAYALMGLFSVSLPILYGEKEKAFVRLQEAIVQSLPNTLSIFAWSLSPPMTISTPPSQAEEQGAFNLFAKSPSMFAHCGSMERVSDSTIPIPGISLTGGGVELQTALGRTSHELADDKYILPLQCTTSATMENFLAIQLRKTPSGYVRASGNLLAINHLELVFEDVSRIHIVKDVSLVQGNMAVQQRESFCRLFFSLETYGKFPCHLQEKVHPKHRLLSSSFNPRRYEFFGPGPGEYFTALMEIRFVSVGDECQCDFNPSISSSGSEFQSESSPATAVAAQIRETVIYAVCGLTAPLSDAFVEDNEFWVTLVPRGVVDAVWGHQYDNPYYLSNLGHRIRALHAMTPEALKPEMRVEVEGTKVKLGMGVVVRDREVSPRFEITVKAEAL